MAKETTTETAPTQTDILLQIAQTLAQVQANAAAAPKDDITGVLDKITETLGGIAHRARPENPEHSRVSAFNPKGLPDWERPQLKCEFWWVGYPLTPETLLDDEIEWLNLLEPGAFMVTKGNGNRIPFTVTPKLRMDGSYERLEVQFPCKDENRSDHRSMIDYIREALGDKVPSLADLQAEVARLKKLVGAAA
jgi:hypothetical protein